MFEPITSAAVAAKVAAAGAGTGVVAGTGGGVLAALASTVGVALASPILPFLAVGGLVAAVVVAASDEGEPKNPAAS